MTEKQAKVLFVDDDTALLGLLRQVMADYSGDAWEIYTAPDAAAALSILQEHGIQLLVTDLHMPMITGFQFLKLLQRVFPSLLKVILTADTSDQERGACLEAGAELYLQKPQATGGWKNIYAILDAMVKYRPEDAVTQRVLRQVGVEDVVQMECLARNSSVVEVFGGATKGKIFIQDGQVVHAVAGELQGEEAADCLLALSPAESRLRPFTSPEANTIRNSWQSLLARAASQKAELNKKEPEAPDQAAKEAVAELLGKEEVSRAVPTEAGAEPAARPVIAAEQAPAPGVDSWAEVRPQIEEILICSLTGEVLYAWQCAQAEARINFLEFLSQKARQIGHGLSLGELGRVETRCATGRTVTRIGTDRAVFVRSSQVPEQPQTAGAMA